MVDRPKWIFTRLQLACLICIKKKRKKLPQLRVGKSVMFITHLRGEKENDE